MSLWCDQERRIRARRGYRPTWLTSTGRAGTPTVANGDARVQAGHRVRWPSRFAAPRPEGACNLGDRSPAGGTGDRDWLALGFRLGESQPWKKLAMAPAEPATTTTAQASSATSTARPRGVNGFLSCDETVSSCTVVKNTACHGVLISVPLSLSARIRTSRVTPPRRRAPWRERSGLAGLEGAGDAPRWW